jgi:hypothetical protein
MLIICQIRVVLDEVKKQALEHRELIIETDKDRYTSHHDVTLFIIAPTHDVTGRGRKVAVGTYPYPASCPPPI